MNLIRKTLYVNNAKGTTYLIAPDSAAMKVLATNPVDANQDLFPHRCVFVCGGVRSAPFSFQIDHGGAAR